MGSDDWELAQMIGNYNDWLVVLSVVVAVIASYTALNLASRVSAWRGSKASRYWLVGGAVSMGSGIWSMHFIGMLAFRLPISMSYGIAITLLSLLMAIVVSGFALYTVSHGTLTTARLLSGGVLMGLGIASMHYTGMAAMEVQPAVRYDIPLFGLSIVIAVGASVAALWMAFRLRSETIVSAFGAKCGSALGMGAAIAGMHYTGMAAANFAPDSICLANSSGIDNVWLAVTVGGIAFMLLATTLVVSVFDARLADRSARLAEMLRKSNAQLEQINERFLLVAKATNDAVWDWDLATDQLWWNDGLQTLFGFRPGEVEPGVESWRSRLHPEERERVVAGIHRLIDTGGNSWFDEYRFRRRDGSYAYVLDRGYVIRDPHGKSVRMIGAMMDITERKRAEEETAKQALYRKIVADFGQYALGGRELDELMYEAALQAARGLRGEQGHVLELAAREKVLVPRAVVGADKTAMVGLSLGSGARSDAAYCLEHKEPVVVEDFRRETNFRHALPPEAAILSGINVIVPGPGSPFGVLAVYARDARRYSGDDVNFLLSLAGVLGTAIERKGAEQRLAFLAQFDTLTGLLNRNLFQDRLGHAIARAQREGRQIALAFLDLDRFKEINDTLGHEAGDRVLKAVSARLLECLRAEDTVARFGGDEFIVMLENIADTEEVVRVARKIMEILSRPVRLGERDLFITASIGLTVYPDDGTDVDSLIKHADIAMYHAKSEGRNTFQFYLANMSAAAHDRMALESDLRQALERREFLLYYQPIVDIESGSLCGVEALLRWRHPARGLMAPGQFIGIAEQTGLIVPIGEWVLREACEQASRWCRAGLPPVQVAVNVSARQFRKSNFAEVVAGALAAAKLDSGLLKLEITESLLMENPDASSKLLATFKSMGIDVALDDFGTGYSSLSYLKQFPLDVLKIDRSFVSDVTCDADDATIVKAMIGLAHSLQLKLTAEGVETEEQLAFLRENGCDYAQGYLFSRPVPAHELEAMLATGQRFELGETASGAEGS